MDTHTTVAVTDLTAAGNWGWWAEGRPAVAEEAIWPDGADRLWSNSRANSPCGRPGIGVGRHSAVARWDTAARPMLLEAHSSREEGMPRTVRAGTVDEWELWNTKGRHRLEAGSTACGFVEAAKLRGREVGTFAVVE